MKPFRVHFRFTETGYFHIAAKDAEDAKTAAEQLLNALADLVIVAVEEVGSVKDKLN